MKGDSIIKKHSIKRKTSHVIFTNLLIVLVDLDLELDCQE